MILAGITGYILGIWIGSFLSVTISLIASTIVLAFLLYVFHGSAGESGAKVALVSVLLVGSALGLLRLYVSDFQAPSQLSQYENKKVTAEGIIVDEPDVREHNTRLTVRLSQVASTTLATQEKIIVSVPLHPEFAYGDKVSLSVVLVRPQEIDNDGRVFDYERYLRVRGIWYTSKYTTMHLVSSGHGALIKSVLFKIKHTFTDSVNRIIPRPESDLLAGLLIGSKQSLGKGLLDEFSRSGVSHVVVLSGYNIAIVAQSVMSFLAFLPGNLSFALGSVSIILFTILAGGGASGTRAAIMVLVALFAQKTNRQYSAGRAFGIAVVLMLIFNPLLLVFDPSFQLSVLATIGIIFVSPYLAPHLTRVTEKYGLREIVSSTIATQLVVLPYLVYNTGLLSLVSLPINILILGTVPLTMFLGFVTGIVGLFSFYLSAVPAFFTFILLWYQLAVVHLGAILPFGAIKISAFSPVVMVLVYLVLGLILYRSNRKIKN